MRLSASNVSWSASGRRIVDGVTLDIAPGESFGLIGPNGSGKSTLLRLLAGLLAPSGGSVAINGVPIAAMTRRDIAQCLAVVEQCAETTEALSARDVVELGRTPWLTALSPFANTDHAIVSEALAAVDMAHMATRRWSTLSGGERQRIQIARALAQRPRLMLLDEPTNHLDIHHQLALLRLVSQLPVTVVMALHDLNQAMGCDRLGVMQGGRLVACGPPCDVLTPDRVAEIFRVRATPLRDGTDVILRFQYLDKD